MPVQEVRIPGASHDPIAPQSDFGCDDDFDSPQSALPASSISPQQATQVINTLVGAIDDVLLRSRPNSVSSARSARPTQSFPTRRSHADMAGRAREQGDFSGEVGDGDIVGVEFSDD